MGKPTPNRAAAVGRWDGDEMEHGARYAYPDADLLRLFDHLGIAAGARVLDVGTGSTFLARKIAVHLSDAHVTAVEADPRMLEVARRNVAEAGLDARIELVQGDAYELPFADEAFDVATSHLVMCILNDPQVALQEQMRVVRPGGTVSAAICFCRTDRLPRYHGRWGLEGDHEIDQLDHALKRAYRTAVRPRLLDLDHRILNQEVAWHFREVGLEDVRVRGHLSVSAPGGDDVSVEEGAAHLQRTYDLEMANIRRIRTEHGAELAGNGFADDAFDRLLRWKQARVDALRADPERVREVMEVYAEPMLLIRGTVPRTRRSGVREASRPDT